jgi:hypothetical protein
MLLLLIPIWGFLHITFWSDDKPDINMVHIFGNVCYVHINFQRKKLDNKSMVGTFLGYDNQSKGFRIYSPAYKKITMSKDAKFDESKFFFQKDSPIIFTNAPMVQYVFPPSESRFYNATTTPSPTLDILDSSSHLLGFLLCVLQHIIKIPMRQIQVFNITTITTIQTFYFLIWLASYSINLSWWLSHWSNWTSRTDFISASCLECR